MRGVAVDHYSRGRFVATSVQRRVDVVRRFRGDRRGEFELQLDRYVASVGMSGPENLFIRLVWHEHRRLHGHDVTMKRLRGAP